MHPTIMSVFPTTPNNPTPQQQKAAAAQAVAERRAAASAYVASWRASVASTTSSSSSSSFPGLIDAHDTHTASTTTLSTSESHAAFPFDGVVTTIECASSSSSSAALPPPPPPLAPTLLQRGSEFSRTRSSGSGFGSSSELILASEDPTTSSAPNSVVTAPAAEADVEAEGGEQDPSLAASASVVVAQDRSDGNKSSVVAPISHGGDADSQKAVAVAAVVDTVKIASTTDAHDKRQLAERMVDSVQSIICSIWPSAREHDTAAASSTPIASGAAADACSTIGSDTSSPSSSSCSSASGLVPLRAFIREILRRSKSSCGTLKCAEWYLTQLRDAWHPTTGPKAGQDLLSELPADSPILCPRRAFLSALILAHKFLHDRVYSNRAWAKVSGLDVREISRGELALAVALEHRLWFCKPDIQEAVEDLNPLATAAGAIEAKRSSSLSPPSVVAPAFVGRPVAPSLVPVRKPMPLSRLSTSSASSLLPPLSPQTASQDSQGSMTLSGSMPGLTLDSKSSSEWEDEGSSPCSGGISRAVSEDGWVHVSGGVQIVIDAVSDDIVAESSESTGKKRLTLSDASSVANIGESAPKKRRLDTDFQSRAILPHL